MSNSDETAQAGPSVIEVNEVPHPEGEMASLRQIALWLVVVAAFWYLLNALDEILKPFFLAVMLGYVILPTYLRIKNRVGRRLALIWMAVGSIVLVGTLSLVVSTSILELSREQKQLGDEYKKCRESFNDYVEEHFPRIRKVMTGDEVGGIDAAKRAMDQITKTATSVISVAVVVVLYLIFMLFEAGRFPRRLERAFPQHHAAPITKIVSDINIAMSEYISGKFLSSGVLAVPIGIVLALFDVKLAAFWAILNFMCNFIPYIGTAIGCGLPLIYSLLTLPAGWQPWAVGVCLILIHLTAAFITEPIILARAVGLSPLLILLALTFWGTCWGFVGILLAVPLSSMAIIILRNIPATRPVSLLLAEE